MVSRIRVGRESEGRGGGQLLVWQRGVRKASAETLKNIPLSAPATSVSSFSPSAAASPSRVSSLSVSRSLVSHPPSPGAFTPRRELQEVFCLERSGRGGISRPERNEDGVGGFLREGEPGIYGG